MDEGRVLRLLSRMNVWWDGEPVPQSLKKAEHRRRDFFIFRKQLGKQRQIAAILGPRQVGKTTLCGQLIDDLLDEPYATPAEHVMYLTIENSQVLSNPENVIQDSIEVYEKHILKESIQSIEDTIYVFIDEIQKSEGWADVLKYYADTYDNIQFVIAGSVSTLIQRDASETLIGRIYRQILMPMKFVDYIRYFEIVDEDTVLDTTMGLKNALKLSVHEGDPSEFSTELTGFYGRNQELEPKLISLKDEYVLKGGYPGVLEEDFPETFAHLDTDLQYTITGDLSSVFNVDKPDKVLQVLSLVAESTGNKLNIQNISDVAGIDRDTVERYLDHLDEFFLVSPCTRYRTSEYQSRGRQKMYLQDVGIYNAIAGTLAEETLNNSDAMGPILETVVLDHCRRLQFNFSGAQNADVHYWSRNGEVDCVLSGPDYTLPIEVKNGDSSQMDLRGLNRFIDASDAEFGLAVNNSGVFEEERNIIHIPVWLFLYLC